MKSVTALAVLLALPAFLTALAGDSVPQFISAAVADTSRPPADTQRDAERKPAESMAFAGVQPKSVVIELIPGGGYYTRLLSKAVGPEGRLYDAGSRAAPRCAGRLARPIACRSRPSRPIRAIGNITVLVQPIKALQLPSECRSGLDLQQLPRRAQCAGHRHSGIQQVRLGRAQARRRVPGHRPRRRRRGASGCDLNACIASARRPSSKRCRRPDLRSRRKAAYCTTPAIPMN